MSDQATAAVRHPAAMPARTSKAIIHVGPTKGVDKLGVSPITPDPGETSDRSGLLLPLGYPVIVRGAGQFMRYVLGKRARREG